MSLQPPRSAHPVVRFSCVDCEPMVIDKLPFDKYELEPSPLTQYILERKSPHMCWQVGSYSNAITGVSSFAGFNKNIFQLIVLP